MYVKGASEENKMVQNDGPNPMNLETIDLLLNTIFSWGDPDEKGAFLISPGPLFTTLISPTRPNILCKVRMSKPTGLQWVQLEFSET